LAINFSGEFTTPRSPEEVFDFLSDPSKFAPLLPDYQSMSMQDATHFTVKVKVGVGNIRGSAELKMELTEAVKPQRAQYKGQGTAVGSQVNVIAGFDLEPNGVTTKVVWKGETSVFGKLASMAGGMLEPLGRKNIQKLIEGLQKALSEPVAAQPLATTAGAPIASPINCEVKADTSSHTANVNPAGEQVPPSSPAEAPGFNSANSESGNTGASAPADERHGNDNA
jgi:uncharacterized protein